MKKQLIITIGFIIFAFSFNGFLPGNENINNLIYMTEEFPPYNYMENNVLKGLAVELLKAMWNQMGINEQPIQVYPWARAYSLIQKKDNHVLFSMSKTKEREKMFKWVGPIHVDKFVLIALKNRNIKLTSLDDIKKVQIGTTRDDVAEQIIAELGVKIREVDRVSNMGANVKKLKMGRIDLVSYSERGFFNFLKKGNYNPEEFAVVFICKEIGSYYAFNKNMPDSLISKFQETLDKLKFEHMQLVNKYLSD